MKNGCIYSQRLRPKGGSMDSYPYASGGVENKNRGDMNGLAFFKAPLKQTPCYQRLPVIGMLRKDIEIGVFDAEKYLSANEGKKMGVNECRTQRHNFKDNKVLFPDEMYYSSDGISSPVSARHEGFTPTASSSPEACCNSQFGLFPNARLRAQDSLSKFPANGLKKWSRKRAIAGLRGICPCLNEKSVDIDERWAPSVSNSLISLSTLKSEPERFGGQQRYSNNKKNDSSVDVFVEKSVATPRKCYHLKRRGTLESHADDMSLKSGYAASCEMALQKSFHFQWIEEPVWPSERSSHHESSEGLLDWNMAEEDSMENGSLGYLFSDYEEMKTMERCHFHGLVCYGREGFFRKDQHRRPRLQIKRGVDTTSWHHRLGHMSMKGMHIIH